MRGPGSERDERAGVALVHGFARVVCHREMLVAYACKRRGACPSCGARRMCGTAAHLVDNVLPDVPWGQWVLTAPHEVRRGLALRPDALTAQGRIFVEEVARFGSGVVRTRGTGRASIGRR